MELISQNNALLARQENKIDEIMAYLEQCHHHVIVKLPHVPAEHYLDFVRGFDPIAYHKVMDAQEKADTTEIEWDEWEQRVELWKNLWTSLLRRLYAKLTLAQVA